MKFINSKIVIVGILFVFVSSPLRAGIADTPHNLSASGRGEVRSIDEKEICFFCHTPHTAEPMTPLWSRSLSNAIYIPYSSGTMGATPGQPTGSSKLCLSCHDGTIALGSVLNRDFEIAMTGTLGEGARLSTDLSDDHPISFDYSESIMADNPELRMPHELTPETPLDKNGQMQCTSCHDAHTDKNEMFLSLPVEYSMLCLSCHDPEGWNQSAHATSSTPVRGRTGGGTVAEKGCGICHVQHGGRGNQHLLREREEENNCLGCHDGTGSKSNILSALNEPYGHDPRNYLEMHEPNEDPSTMPRHVECQDCHAPHAVNSHQGQPGGASGVGIDGMEVDPASQEFEVCFRCHGEAGRTFTDRIVRSSDQSDLKRKFNPTNPSFHPIVGPGQSGDVPSLKARWNESSVIACGDCHNNSDPNGARGPHGSMWPGLLELNYNTQDGVVESMETYAMCYKCHDRDNLMSDETFPHRSHVENGRASCSACHDPHGVDGTLVSDGSGGRLISFDLEVVSPEAASGRIAFEAQGPRSGQCYLSCHGENHAPRLYLDGKPAANTP